jgi:hypothetical protein
VAQDENLREGKWIFEAADGMGRLFLGVVADHSRRNSDEQQAHCERRAFELPGPSVARGMIHEARTAAGTPNARMPTILAEADKAVCDAHDLGVCKLLRLVRLDRFDALALCRVLFKQGRKLNFNERKAVGSPPGWGDQSSNRDSASQIIASQHCAPALRRFAERSQEGRRAAFV